MDITEEKPKKRSRKKIKVTETKDLNFPNEMNSVVIVVAPIKIAATKKEFFPLVVTASSKNYNNSLNNFFSYFDTKFFMLSLCGALAISFAAYKNINITNSEAKENKESLVQSHINSLTTSIIAPENKLVNLKLEKTLDKTILFWNGTSALGPKARQDIRLLASQINSSDDVNLYGYAGKNAKENKEMQTRIAFTRAFNAKVQLVNSGVQSSQINIVDPNQYLFDKVLPADPKQVVIKIIQK